ncbi:DUF2785 domain-containing protein [Solibacillus sp. Sa1YVA6]|uniref:DUF2785 domain-containing protein n=1 Tax=Solibacillus merdavium TaxID=2762218 RepID=A0ABR8XLU3_9BACL|nr:DUF2785 domain-containing protein [Solibacillus merdavium]
MLVEDYDELFEMSVDERKHYIQLNPTIVENLLDGVGKEDAAIRDKLNYRLFIQLLTENALSEKMINQFVDHLFADKGLLANIGESGTGAVFQRSYSALYLAAIVNADRQLSYLNKEQLEQITQNAIDLLLKEQDLRSYVNLQSGWAHSVANACELLCAIIEHPEYSIRFTFQILQAIRANLWKDYVFIDDEDERFCNVINAMIVKGIEEDLFIEWFEQLFDQLEAAAYSQGYSALWYKARTNQLNLSKTLYFYLKFANRHEKLRSIVSIFIQRWIKLG